jgi:hypothetical protein
MGRKVRNEREIWEHVQGERNRDAETIKSASSFLINIGRACLPACNKALFRVHKRLRAVKEVI